MREGQERIGKRSAQTMPSTSRPATSTTTRGRIIQELEEHFTRDTLRALSLFEEVAELTLEYAIGVLSLLLFLELDAIFARLTTAVVAVLSRRIVLLGEYLVGTEDRCAKLTGDL